MDLKKLFTKKKLKRIMEKTTGQKPSYERPEREMSDREKAIHRANERLKKKRERMREEKLIP